MTPINHKQTIHTPCLTNDNPLPTQHSQFTEATMAIEENPRKPANKLLTQIIKIKTYQPEEPEIQTPPICPPSPHPRCFPIYLTITSSHSPILHFLRQLSDFSPNLPHHLCSNPYFCIIFIVQLLQETFFYLTQRLIFVFTTVSAMGMVVVF